MYFFCADYNSEICFVLSFKLSEEQALEVSRFIGTARQTTQNKRLIHPSILRQFRVYRKEKSSYRTEHFNMLCQFG
jgi:hypothetical protein